MVNRFEVRIKGTDEHLSSARKELLLLEQYASTVASHTSKAIPDPETMRGTLNLYKNQCAEYFDEITACAGRLAAFDKGGAKAMKGLDKDRRAFSRATMDRVEKRQKKQA